MGGRWLALLVTGLAALAAGSGCLRSDTAACADGRLCPTGTVCDDLHRLCVFPEQLTSCDPLAEGDPCELGGTRPGVCVDGVCLEVGCGDQLVAGTEQCDGTNLNGKDDCTDLGYYQAGTIACRSDCTFDTTACEHICGDGELDADREQCDDPSGTLSRDCTEFLFYHPGPVACSALCRWDVSSCTGSCGDGIVEAPEFCDTAPPPDTQTCVTLGYDAGFLDCSLCGPGLDDCKVIGWREVELGNEDQVTVHGAGPFDVYAVYGDYIVQLDEAGAATMPHPPAGSLVDVWATAPDDIWVIGDGGALHSDGTTWSTVATGATSALRQVWASSATDVWLVVAPAGAAPTLRHYDGTSWTAVAARTEDLRGIWGTSATDVHVWGPGGVLRFDGTSWAPLTTPLDDVRVLWSIGTTVFVGGFVGAEVALARRVGGSWTTETLPGMQFGSTVDVLWGTAPDNVYAFGGFGLGLHWNGVRWSPIVELNSTHYSSAWGSGADDIWISGPGGLLKHGEGSVWHTDTPPTPFVGRLSVVALAGLSADEVYALSQAGSGQRVDRFDGRVWTFATPFSTVTSSSDLAVVSATEMYTSGAVGRVQRWNGSAWSNEHTGGSNLTAVWAAGSGQAFAVGEGGTILRRSGATWPSMTSGSSVTLHDVWGTGASDVFAVGEIGTILHWDGTAWSTMTSGTTVTLRAVWGDSSQDVLAVGDGGVIVRFDGATWSPMDSRQVASLYQVMGTSGDDVFASGSGDVVLHWDGERWAPVRNDADGTIDAMWVTDGVAFMGDGFGWIGWLTRTAPW